VGARVCEEGEERECESVGGEGVACDIGGELEDDGVGGGAGADRVMLGSAWEKHDIRMKLAKSREKTSEFAVMSEPTSLLLHVSDAFASGKDLSYDVMEMLNVFGRMRRGRWFCSCGVPLWSTGLSNSSDRRSGFSIEPVAGGAGDCSD